MVLSMVSFVACWGCSEATRATMHVSCVNPHRVGKMATSPLPYRGSPPLQSGVQNQKWPTSGQNGYLTPAVSGIPTASERGAKSEVAHKWAKWVRHPCRLGDPHRFRAGGKIRSGAQKRAGIAA